MVVPTANYQTIADVLCILANKQVKSYPLLPFCLITFCRDEGNVYMPLSQKPLSLLKKIDTIDLKKLHIWQVVRGPKADVEIWRSPNPLLLAKPRRLWAIISVKNAVTYSTDPNLEYSRKQIIPCQSKQTHKKTLPTVNPGLETTSDGSLSLDIDLFHLKLLYVFHFSSPITIRYRYGPNSLRASRDSQMELLSIKIILVNSCGTHSLSFVLQSTLFKWFQTVYCEMFSALTIETMLA